MRALVLAQGQGKRWDHADGTPYLGHPKHLCVVDGETLIGRTVRQLGERGVTDVVVVARDEPGYRLPGTRLVTLEDPRPTGTNQDKLLATRDLWAGDDRTVVMFGDVFHSDEAVDLIVGHPSDALHYFRRPTPSEVTGHRWDETFAVSFGPGEHGHVVELAEHVAGLASGGRIRSSFLRCHYAASLGLPLRDLCNRKAILSTPGQTIIDDWTDDIDGPPEWRAFMGRRYAGAYRVAVCIPWAGDDPWRTQARDHVVAHYQAQGCAVFLGEVEPDGRYVNRSRARNRAVAAALATGPEVLFLADADVFVPADQLWSAARLAVLTDQLVLAFDEYVKLSEAATRQVFARRRVELAGNGIRGHASCAMALTPAVWAAVGGYDERFRGWLGEDRAFWLACRTLPGLADRIDGPAWHLHHPPAWERHHRDDPVRVAAVELAARYKRAAGSYRATGALERIGDGVDRPADVDAFVAIMREAGGPLDPARPPVVPACGPAPASPVAAPSVRYQERHRAGVDRSWWVHPERGMRRLVRVGSIGEAMLRNTDGWHPEGGP